MKVARTREELRAALAPGRAQGQSIGLVPTMGALHRGHITLIEAASEQNDLAAVSIFVNPTQFGQGEDFDGYPRDEERDLELARGAGAGLAYLPTIDEVYPTGFATKVKVPGLTEVLCGHPSRRGPEHFEGVTIVVCKLLNAFRPDRAYFGRKDAQQVAVIRRMVEDLEIPVEIVAMPTVREPDGLAMSSRNAYLDRDQRRTAAAIPASLDVGARSARSDRDLVQAVETVRRALEEAGVEAEYVEARDPDTLEPMNTLNASTAMIAVAARFGPARLIDNTLIDPNGNEEEAPR